MFMGRVDFSTSTTGCRTALHTSSPSRLLNLQFYSEGIQLHPAPRKDREKEKKDRQRGEKKINDNPTEVELSLAVRLLSLLRTRFVFPGAIKVYDCLGVYFTPAHHINLETLSRIFVFFIHSLCFIPLLYVCSRLRLPFQPLVSFLRLLCRCFHPSHVFEFLAASPHIMW